MIHLNMVIYTSVLYICKVHIVCVAFWGVLDCVMYDNSAQIEHGTIYLA